MKNFPITVEKGELAGQTFWISRAIAVVGCVLQEYDGVLYVLANKRGIGTPDFQGYWNLPCGYLDYNETTKEAVVREVLEETGVNINPTQLKLWKFKDSPEQNRQNVSFIYYHLKGDLLHLDEYNKGEENEVEEIKWISLKEINDYKWAFNHDLIINEIILDVC